MAKRAGKEAAQRIMQQRKRQAAARTGSHRNNGHGFTSVPIAGRQYPKGIIASRGSSVPKCPTCDTQMIARTSKQKEPFWGCARFPHCKQTVAVQMA